MGSRFYWLSRLRRIYPYPPNSSCSSIIDSFHLISIEMHSTKDKKFKLTHLFLGTGGLLIIEGILLLILRVGNIEKGIILHCTIVGAVMNIYIAIEAIEEVKSRLHILVFLSLIVLEFIIF